LKKSLKNLGSNQERLSFATRFYGVLSLRRSLFYLLSISAEVEPVNRTTIAALILLYLTLFEPIIFPNRSPPLANPEWISYLEELLLPRKNLFLSLMQLDLATVSWPGLAYEFSLPDWLLELVQNTFTFHARDFLKALNFPGPITLRGVLSLHPRSSLQNQLLEISIPTIHGSFSNAAIHINSSVKPTIRGMKLFNQGTFEVQDEGSQLISLACGIQTLRNNEYRNFIMIG
jgi:hypothetical protein